MANERRIRTDNLEPGEELTMPFQPYITPQSYYDEQAEATRKYVAWLNLPRVSVIEPQQETFLIKRFRKRSAAFIKAQLLAGL